MLIISTIIICLLFIWYLIKDEIIGETNETKDDIGYEILRRRWILKRDESLSPEEIDDILKIEFSHIQPEIFLTYLAYCNHHDVISEYNTKEFVRFSYTDHCNCRYNSFMYNHYGTKTSIDDFTIHEVGRSGGSGGSSGGSSSQSSHSYNFDDGRYL